MDIIPKLLVWAFMLFVLIDNLIPAPRISRKQENDIWEHMDDSNETINIKA